MLIRAYEAARKPGPWTFGTGAKAHPRADRRGIEQQEEYVANTVDVGGLVGLEGANDATEGAAELAVNILERFGEDRIAQAWIFVESVRGLVRSAMVERQEALMAQAEALSAVLGSAPAAARAPRKKAEAPPEGVADAPSLPTQEEVATCVLSLLQLGEGLSMKAMKERITGSTHEQVKAAVTALGPRVVRGAQKSYRLAPPSADKQVTIPGAT